MTLDHQKDSANSQEHRRKKALEDGFVLGHRECRAQDPARREPPRPKICLVFKESRGWERSWLGEGAGDKPSFFVMVVVLGVGWGALGNA